MADTVPHQRADAERASHVGYELARRKENLMALFSISSNAENGDSKSQLARIERKLDLLLVNLGIQAPTDDGLEDVRALVKQGPKSTIAAIALYRKKTGASLAEAKRAIENDF